MLNNTKKILYFGKQAFVLFLLEIALSIIAVFEFFKVIGLNWDFESKTIYFAQNSDYSNTIVLIIAIVLLFAINFRLKKKFPEFHSIQNLFLKNFKKGVKEKFAETKNEPRILAHLMIEFAFIMVIILVFYAWAEPRVEIIKWEKIGIIQPITTALNAIVLLVVLAGLYYLYHFTKPYRIERKAKKAA